MTRRIHSSFVVAMGLAAVGLAACGGGTGGGDARPAPNATADGPGVITGRVSFAGEPPPRTRIRMAADPSCMPNEQQALSASLIVGPEGGLQNVFVHVKDGLGNRVYAAPTAPVVLDQVGCQYEPRVFGVFVGQPIEIHNSDPTLHNVHAIPKENAEFNFGQQARTPPVMRTFDRPEVGVSIQCDVHGWMRAYASVVEHPFFSVTGEDGTFEISGLPPGTYTIEAWHERLGTQTQQITIGEDDPTAEAAFSFSES